MGIFDALTGGPGVAAADASRDYLGRLQDNLIGATGITKDQNAGLFRTGFGDARTDLGTGYGTATGAINTGAGGALDFLRTGSGNAVNTLTAGGGAYRGLDDLIARYRPGATLYADAAGVNGPEGSARAREAYTTSPGFDATFDRGIDAINRRRNAGGMLASGNADRDAQTFGHDLSLADYNSWFDRLAPYNNLELGATTTAAAGNAGTRGAVASIQNNAGQNMAGVATGQGSSLADLARGFYVSRAGLDTGEAGALAGNNNTALDNATRIGLNVAPQVTKTYNDAADSQMRGSANTIGLGLNLAKLAAGATGGASTGGSSFLPSSSFMNNSWGW